MEGKNSDRALLIYSDYVRSYRAVVVIWAIFTMCFVVIDVIAFSQPQWIGDTDDSLGVGYFGLYQFCELFSSDYDLVCTGALDEFGDIISTPFKAATILVGCSCLLSMICVACLLLFCVMKQYVVLIICGCIQLLTGLLLFLGCIIYPLGWDADEVQRICGHDADEFDLDECGIRWAYILAIVGIFDVLALGILAFVLAGRVAHDPVKSSDSGSVTGRSEVYIAETKSEPSMIITPRVTAGPGSHVGTEYSHASSRRSGKGRRGDFAL